MAIFDLSKKIAILILLRMYALYVKQFIEEKIKKLFKEWSAQLGATRRDSARLGATRRDSAELIDSARLRFKKLPFY